MGYNAKKMRKGYESQKRGGEFFTFDQGDTKCFIHPPCRGDDDEYEPTEGLNYIPVVVHYQVGKNNAMVVCQDPENNPIIEHPFVKAFLKKRKIRLDGECAVCAEIKDGMDDDEADDCRAQTRYMWGLTPLAHRASKGDEWRKLTPKPCVAMVGKTLYDGIMELFFDNGDISEYGAAILAKINRDGKGARDTKYKVVADVATLKKPLKLHSELRKMLLKAIAEGKDCDLFKIVASMIKAPAAVRAALTGVALDESDDDDDDIEDADGDGEEDPEDEPESTSKKGGKSKSKPKKDPEDEPEEEPEDDPEEDPEDDPEEDPEEEPEPTPKKGGKSKSKPKGDDDLGLDALDEELSRISKGKIKSKSKT